MSTLPTPETPREPTLSEIIFGKDENVVDDMCKLLAAKLTKRDFSDTEYTFKSPTPEAVVEKYRASLNSKDHAGSCVTVQFANKKSVACTHSDMRPGMCCNTCKHIYSSVTMRVMIEAQAPTNSAPRYHSAWD